MQEITLQTHVSASCRSRPEQPQAKAEICAIASKPVTPAKMPQSVVDELATIASRAALVTAAAATHSPVVAPADEIRA